MLDNAQRAFRELLKGSSFQEWVEDKIDRLILTSGQTTPPVRFRSIYGMRRIKSVTFDEMQVSKGRLWPIKGGFSISISEKYSPSIDDVNTRRLRRFYISHEIAHTFFFETTLEIPQELFPNETGSPLLEFCCNWIARALLMPHSMIVNKLRNYPSPIDQTFQNNLFSFGTDVFDVTRFTFCTRIIHDLGYWKCGIFILQREKSLGTWHLIERYVPYWIANDRSAFIPRRTSKDPTVRLTQFPSLKGPIVEILDETIASIAQPNSRISVPTSKFHGSILERFTKATSKHKALVDLIISSYQIGSEDFIWITIPLEDSAVGKEIK